MGIGDRLARRKVENRIRRKSIPREQVDPEAELDAMVQNVQDRAYRIGKRIFDASQARKTEGKQILKGWVKHGIGETYRGVVGPKQKQQKRKK